MEKVVQIQPLQGRTVGDFVALTKDGKVYVATIRTYPGRTVVEYVEPEIVVHGGA